MARERVKAVLDEFRPKFESAITEFKTKSGAALQEAKNEVASLKNTNAEVAALKKQADGVLAGINTAKAACDTRLSELDAAIKEQDESFEEGNTVYNDLQAKMKAIQQFYDEMNGQRKVMDDSVINLKQKVEAIKKDGDRKVEEYNQSVNIILENVKSQQSQIDNHLEQAVGISLFHSFAQRTKEIMKGKVFWQWVLIVSSALGVAAGFWIFSTVGDTFNTAFFARLTIALPLLLLIGFSGLQYKRERHAEEEYAFKSAISLSLKPYFDLVERVRQEHEEDPEYLKQLVDEVFFNPVPRIHIKNYKRDLKPIERPKDEQDEDGEESDVLGILARSITKRFGSDFDENKMIGILTKIEELIAEE